MRKSAVFSTLALAAAFALGAAAFDDAMAKPGAGKGGGWKAAGGGAPGFGHGMRSGWHGAHQPPGWSRGKKRGWYKGSVYRGSVPPGWR